MHNGIPFQYEPPDAVSGWDLIAVVAVGETTRELWFQDPEGDRVVRALTVSIGSGARSRRPHRILATTSKGLRPGRR